MNQSAAEPVKVGIVCEITGPSAANGTKKWERAVQMAAEEINKSVLIFICLVTPFGRLTYRLIPNLDEPS